MKQKTKRFCALALVCILSLLLSQTTNNRFVRAANTEYEQTETPTDAEEVQVQARTEQKLLGDLGGENFSVSPIGTLVKDVLSGEGSYFAEIHNLFTCTGEDASRIAAYCLNPARTAPESTTSYREYANGNIEAFMTENKSGASAVLMYGYGGESSINNSCIGLANPNKNIGGSYGIYVINGKASFGLLINGIFYPLDPLEAQAVTAAAIHKLNGSSISTITDTSGGNIESSNKAFDALYQFGSWAERHINEYGYTATSNILNANNKASRSIDLFVKDTTGKLLTLPANAFEKDFDWSPYTVNNQIVFEVQYKAMRCESRLIKSNQKGTSNHISYTHTSITEFPGVPSANGYYDYFEITESKENTIPVSVTYQPLCTEDFQTSLLGVVSSDGSFQKGTGQLFTQKATICIFANDLAKGKVLDLAVEVPEAASFTPFYGDGDMVDGSYNSGRFFYANGYQDMVVSSPYTRMTILSKSLRAQTEPITKASFQIEKYSKFSDGTKAPLQSAGFMACNVKDLQKQNGCYQFDKAKAIVLCKDGSKELFTDSNGYACSILLEEGQYLVHETTVPKNHFATDEFIITITKDSPALLPAVKCIDTAFEAYISIYKIDSYSRLSIKNNPATFRIWSFNSESYVNFSSTDTVQYDIKTDENGLCKTPLPLKAGRYHIEEVSPPKGYYCSTNNTIDFEVGMDNAYDTYEDNSFVYSYVIENTPMYAAIELYKTGEKRIYDIETQKYTTFEIPLSNVSFEIYADRNIYSQDGNMNLLFEQNDLIDTLITDENGYACSNVDIPLGSYILHENTPENYIEHDDVLFDITTDDLCIEQTVGNTVSKKLIKTFNIHNKIKIPTLETSAINKKSNSKTGTPTSDDIVSDTIYYTNLVAGTTYTIKGELMDKETSKPLMIDGASVTAEKTFTCQTSDGTIDLDFHLDSTSLAGSEIVLYEKLYFKDEIICVHEDINNTKQTIEYEAPPVSAPPVNKPPSGSPPKDEPPSKTPPTDVPKTGDSSPIIPIIFLCACSLLSFIIFFFRNQIFKFLKKHIIN